MDTTHYHKARDLISKSKSVLLVTRVHPSDDAVSSLIALGLVLEQMGKDVDLVCHGPLSTSLEFLPKFETITPTLGQGRHFKITLDTSQSKVSQFTYDFDNDGKKLNIFVTPEAGMFSDSHVVSEVVGPSYDVILTLGAPDLDSLGAVYEENTRLFFETPIIVIDCDVENDMYGEVNCVDVKATTTAEVVFDFLQHLGKDNVDDSVATTLLAGIIGKTRSFQSEKTTPRTFSIAAELVQKGADQQRIVKQMFKSKSLGAIRLWGRALLHLDYDEQVRIVSTAIKKEDFIKTQTSEKDLVGIEEELLATVGDARAIVVAVQKNEAIEIVITIQTPSLVSHLAEQLGGTVSRNTITITHEAGDFDELFQATLFNVKQVLSSQVLTT